ncbi:type II toxin-antitoxin system ParD family antitoxin [Thalassotalea sp. 1_MG-2023]|uniref:type II toxin-antitoxin system ParD family antitoxin n=1 Tax=Thalassotalea sp. 1_MG-2023 TaxID=3062680 RepID=UPI0026E26CD6|nr:type II toxin-antitoxin system ParD family antitoxin [Thalassotalea sp. 1_MG-2023]MDO6428421.1 type II toxin-antitoxin system ParD family antitoxin [Thalassotalea sp. 1_MG-2023]
MAKNTSVTLGVHLINQQLNTGRYGSASEVIRARLRTLAFKWIRILFRCWKTNTAYDESTYLEALKNKGSPLLKFAVESKV